MFSPAKEQLLLSALRALPENEQEAVIELILGMARQEPPSGFRQECPHSLTITPPVN